MNEFFPAILKHKTIAILSVLAIVFSLISGSLTESETMVQQASVDAGISILLIVGLYFGTRKIKNINKQV